MKIDFYISLQTLDQYWSTLVTIVKVFIGSAPVGPADVFENAEENGAFEMDPDAEN